jgi:hypothetical protein
MILGLEYAERYEGTFYFLNAPETEYPMRAAFRVRARAWRNLVRERSVELSGTLSAGELCEEAPITGTVGFKVSTRRIPYEFWFFATRSGAAEKLRFLGEKDIHMVWPRDSVELLVASIFDESGAEIARARLRYRLKEEIWHTVKSMRLRVFDTRSPQ